ncbi:MAG: sensor histidine kinase [Flavisolibacter sp.]
MNRKKLNTELLLSPPFKQNVLVVFLVHWLAWLLLHFITFLPTLLNSKIVSWEIFFFNHFYLVTLSFLLFYIVAFFIMPKMATLQKKWFWVLIASLLLAIVFTYLKFRTETWHSEYLMRKAAFFNKFPRRTTKEDLGIFSYRFRTYFEINILINVSIVIVAFAYRLLLIWFQQEKIKAELQNQRLRSELSYLRMQVNPHFLFNALNNIYSLSVIENTKRTSDSILKLSELMRYMLYEKEDAENKVSLDKEIQHINSYIDLEKLRHTEDIFVNFSIEGHVNGKRIAPLLLFPLIENAFKHGILTEKGKPLDIEMKISDGRLNFTIENFNNTHYKDKVGGIGVQNVKKRLDLLYGNKYEMNVDHTKERYIVNLQLPL